MTISQAQSDCIGFNIFVTFPKKRNRAHTPEECERFLRMCVDRYKEKRGVAPNVAYVPDDYCGGNDVIRGLQIEKDSKPRGHYLIGVSPQES